jgi:UDP-GlcNAc:undecaprenyl-phosphate GlcNAc-1-phosphate transferase
LAIAALAGTILIVFVLRPLAARLGLIDLPDARKRHDAPTPAIGGIAIFGAIGLLGLIFQPRSPQLVGFDLAALVLVITGVVDDRHRLRWRLRMGAQILAALILIHVAGVRVEDLGRVLGVPLHLNAVGTDLVTVVSVVGIINAINMMDGVDGLAGAVSLAAIAMLTGVAVYAGNMGLAGDLTIVMGALVGFLAFNMRFPWSRRASIFLGNAGAELLGLIIAAACFRLTQNPLHPIGPKLAPFLVAPALVDCLTLIIRRVRRGDSPFQADRNHLHHLLLDAGFSASGVVLGVSGLTLIIGSLAILATKAHVPDPGFTLAFLALWLGYAVATHSQGRFVRVLAALGAPFGWAPHPVAPTPDPATADSSAAARRIAAE